MILQIFSGGDTAEIVLGCSVFDAMDLVRLLLAHGVTTAKITKLKPATGEPAINIRPQRRIKR